MTKPSGSPVPERHLYRIPEAMQLLSMSRSVIYEQIRSGRLKTVNQGSTPTRAKNRHHRIRQPAHPRIRRSGI